MQFLQKFYEIICCISKPLYPTIYNFPFEAKRTFPENQKNFESNFVRTSKYTWYTFFPKAIILQFKRLANVYFLIIAILQTIPETSPLDPTTAWIPLSVVLVVSLIRQGKQLYYLGYEDYQRWKSDVEMNHQSQTRVYSQEGFSDIEWSKVVIGNVVLVQQDELFPCDLILLASSVPDGTAFIETASLDGEKNLKPRASLKATAVYNDEQMLGKLRGQWQGIVPDKQLHKFSSKMRLQGHEDILMYEGDKQLLYRGARLKNTKWIYGLTIYTGHNTKIMMNSESSSIKMSQIQVKVNYVLIFILLIQVILSFITGILYGIFRFTSQSTNKYINWGDTSIPLDSALIFFNYLVLINTMIPISLIVSIEVVKFAQSLFIRSDKLMYSEFRNKSASVKSASLNQQLGQIQYIFTDKTGTLTMNIMEFKIAVIGDRMFGDLGLIIRDPLRPPQNQKGFHDEDLNNLIQRGQGNKNIAEITVKDREGNQVINLKNTKMLANQYLQALSMAHEVVVEKNKNGESFFQGPSPDEITLVDAAKCMHYQFIKSTQSTTTIEILGKQKTIQLLELFAFTSDRKRMSVLVRDAGVIKMYTKGADSIIKSRLSSNQSLNLDDELNSFSRIGLRTLLIAMRLVSEKQYAQFKKNVQSLPTNNKQKQFEELVSNLENGLYLIGATAVLDRLQDQVPETIRDLIRADIKIWMLTGDKMQTAENIGKSCNLIQSHFKIIHYECENNQNILTYLKSLVEQVEKLHQDSEQKAFLIQGSDLTPILSSDQCQTQLANLSKHCQAVICCRLLPIQKAQVVSIVRNKLKCITLSIGDGANDVPMIKTAHIGVGLFGEQGMGAVQASDYALPQFRMLWRLLLVHGRWNYIRISEMILYFFYKNMLFTVPQIIFAFFSGYSAQTVFDDIYIAGYNLLFTSVPLVIRAVLEQDINYIREKKYINQIQEHSQQHINNISILQTKQDKYLPKQFHVNKYLYRLFPKLYFIGQQNCIFNYTNYFLWVTEGVLQAILISFFCLKILGGDKVSLSQAGENSDLWIVSLTIFSAIIAIVTFKLASHTKFWSFLLLISILIFSVGLYLGFMWISELVGGFFIQNTVLKAWTNAEAQFTILFTICLILFIDGIVTSIDFERGGYASKMRTVIDAEKQQQKSYYEEMSLLISDNLTVQPK